MRQKKAIITGVTGQDGAYLSRLLLSKGYEVYGLKRRTSLINTDRLDEIFLHKNFKLLYYDLNDTGAIWKLLLEIQPDEIYNLAAQSHVRVSFEIPEHTVDGIAMGTLRILDAMKTVCPRARFYQASSSEMFGPESCLTTNLPCAARLSSRGKSHWQQQELSLVFRTSYILVI